MKWGVQSGRKYKIDKGIIQDFFRSISIILDAAYGPRKIVMAPSINPSINPIKLENNQPKTGEIIVITQINTPIFQFLLKNFLRFSIFKESDIVIFSDIFTEICLPLLPQYGQGP